MNRWLLLIAWLSGTVFPYTWLRNESSRFRRLVDTFFAAEWTHVVGHLALYATLAFLLWWALRRAPGLPGAAATLALALPVGLAQETLQTLFRHRAFGAPEVFDLFVDLTGVVIGLLAACRVGEGNR
ncbi:MAG: VanZ family protein [Chloroflexi bacterium]|nr:VanZ family protein [Chloroflexota bacterium]